MRREVLAAAGNAAAVAPRKKADSGLYKTAIFTFFGVYLIGQCIILLQDSSPLPAGSSSSVVRNAVRYQSKESGSAWDSILSAGRGSSDGVVAQAADPNDAAAARAAVTERTHTKGWVAAVGNEFDAKVTNGGPDFKWSSLDTEPGAYLRRPPRRAFLCTRVSRRPLTILTPAPPTPPPPHPPLLRVPDHRRREY